MSAERLNEDHFKILAAIREKGGTDCTGTCHHRKPGEFHCHTLGRMLNLSSQGVKNRILELLRCGLVERERIERDSSSILIRFTITQKGQEGLDLFLHSQELKQTNEVV